MCGESVSVPEQREVDASRLPKPVLRDTIRERIIERIMDGSYGPGARIVESQLAAEFGTSQAPVREALRDLEALRFVESQPHRGARVRAITSAELGQIYPVRAALEEVAGLAAAATITDDVLDALGTELDDMRSAAEHGDMHDQLRHDARFHELIVEAADNRILLEVWRSLRVEASTLVSVIKTNSDLRFIAEMHRPILAALQVRNAELAGSEMRRHIEFFGSIVVGMPTQGPAEG